MAFINTNFFSLLFLAIVALLLVSQNANAQPADISPYCKTATSKRFCNKVVNGATDLQDASVKAITIAIVMAKNIQYLAPQIKTLALGLDPEISSQLYDQCTESFSNTVDDLTLSLQLLKKGDMGGVATRLSAAFDSDCGDALKEAGVNFPALTKITGMFAKVMDNALAVTLQD